MQLRKLIYLLTAITILLGGAIAYGADQKEATKDVTTIATARPTAEIWPAKRAGLNATSEILGFSRDNLAAIVGEKATAYQEYLVTEAYQRQYGAARVDIFQTENPFAAFGLFTYAAGVNKTALPTPDFGSASARLADAVIFWKNNYLVRVTAPGAVPLQDSLARSISDTLGRNKQDINLPPLLESLPSRQAIAESQRYFLGPESLNDYVERGRDMFGFAGDAEAAMSEYAPGSEPAAQTSRVRLLIVEYHTPQFAYDALARVNTYLNTLSEEERNRIIVKRQGNYIVEATNFDDREFAQGLIDSVEYPYTVKLLDPLTPYNDPFHTQKAARMLISTFSIMGLAILIVLFVGSTFGAIIFLKRRKQQREMFSDAGGMVRLDLDPFEAVILGLPPKRSDE